MKYLALCLLVALAACNEEPGKPRPSMGTMPEKVTEVEGCGLYRFSPYSSPSTSEWRFLVVCPSGTTGGIQSCGKSCSRPGPEVPTVYQKDM